MIHNNKFSKINPLRKGEEGPLWLGHVDSVRTSEREVRSLPAGRNQSEA